MLLHCEVDQFGDEGEFDECITSLEFIFEVSKRNLGEAAQDFMNFPEIDNLIKKLIKMWKYHLQALLASRYEEQGEETLH